MATRLRQLANGMLIAPKRGAPPIIPEGYEIWNDDPYILTPTLKRCQHREYREPKKRCCGASKYMYCSLLQKRVVASTCMRCKL